MQADGQTDRYDGAKSFNYEYDRDLNICGYYLCVYVMSFYGNVRYSRT